MAEESTKHSVHPHEAVYMHKGPDKEAAKHEHEKKSGLKIKPLYATVAVLAIIIIIAGFTWQQTQIRL